MIKKGISFWNPITNGQHANSILKSFRYFKLRFCYDIRQQSFIVIKISSKYKMRELYYRKIYTFLSYLFPLDYKKALLRILKIQNDRL